MNRRRFIQRAGALAGATAVTLAMGGGAGLAWAAPAVAGYRRLLILVELKGGNDGLNTVVPYADPAYLRLRPKIAIARDAVIVLSDAAGLHPALAPLEPLWKANEMAMLQGVGYAEPNLSHFRSIEIWDTGSDSASYLQEGWLARAFAARPVPRDFAADGVLVGSSDLGPLAGSGTRAIALANTGQFVRQAKLANDSGTGRSRALEHILKVEGDIVQAAMHLGTPRTFATTFPQNAFGNAVRTACEVIANPAGVAVVRLTLSSFDTHGNQPATQARLLGELASGVVALKSALEELGRWDETLIVTYAEFGRRPKENLSLGTDHGTASVHFAWGGRVRGGFYGAPPALDRLDGNGNLPYAIDFHALYATVLEQWWDVPASSVGIAARPVEFLRA